MPRRRQTKVGKLNPVDVRSKKDVGALESLLGKGPLTIVLVYADWCGHCQTFKQNMWNQVSTMPNKTVNTASVHYDMVDNTSLKNAKIDGYPSLLLVGTNKKPATFKTDAGETNAMPAPSSVNELKNMVNTPINNAVSSADTVANNVVNNATVNSEAMNETNNILSVNETVTSNNTNANNVTSVRNNNTVVANNTNSVFTNAKRVNSYKPSNADELAIPDTSADMASNTLLRKTEVAQGKVGGGQRGGSETLLTALARISMEAGHVGGLLLAATEYSDLVKRFTRRHKKGSKKTAKRRQRR